MDVVSLGRAKASPFFEYMTGFEGTHIFGSGRDVLETTEHTTRYPEDLLRLRQDGMSTLRACIPWHRIEQHRGTYDWRWTDRYLTFVRMLGLDPIVDPLHHTSFPAWLEGGFADPEFEPCYLAFLEAFAHRYPWIKRYTVINEPFVTAWLCGYCEIWQPRHRGHAGFVPMLLAVARTICLATAMLERLVPGVQFLHTDSCERHLALDEDGVDEAARGNMLRFAVLDLVLGRVDEQHELHPYLVGNGAEASELAWFWQHTARIDVLGLDYYPHSELAWSKSGRMDVHPTAGFRSVALDYARRYRCPVMLSETNLRGTVEDRISWLRYMALECEALAAELAGSGQVFAGFCWYPYVDSTDWSSLVREARGEIDPQGLYSLTPALERRSTELSAIFAALAKGTMRPTAIPAYRFSHEALTERGVGNFLPHMDWRWKEPTPALLV